MTSKLTRKQRNRVYKDALWQRVNGGSRGRGLCSSLNWSYGRLINLDEWLYCADIIEMFPEFAACKPHDAKVYWWPRDADGEQIRRGVLVHCIRQTETWWSKLWNWFRK